MKSSKQWLNGKALAAACGCGEWTIYGIKKSNRIAHSQSRERLIFTGRLSTPAKINAWLEEHPEFIPGQVLAPVRRKKEPARQAPPPLPQHQAA